MPEAIEQLERDADGLTSEIEAKIRAFKAEEKRLKSADKNYQLIQDTFKEVLLKITQSGTYSDRMRLFAGKTFKCTSNYHCFNPLQFPHADKHSSPDCPSYVPYRTGCQISSHITYLFIDTTLSCG